MKLTISKKLMKLARLVWEDRNNGRHAWKKFYNKFITIEAVEEDREDCLVVTLTDEIDDLGYCYGNVLDTAFLYAEDFEG